MNTWKWVEGLGIKRLVTVQLGLSHVGEDLQAWDVWVPCLKGWYDIEECQIVSYVKNYIW